MEHIIKVLRTAGDIFIVGYVWFAGLGILGILTGITPAPPTEELSWFITWLLGWKYPVLANALVATWMVSVSAYMYIFNRTK